MRLAEPSYLQYVTPYKQSLVTVRFMQPASA